MIWPWWLICQYVDTTGKECRLRSEWYIVYGPDPYKHSTIRCDLHRDTVRGREVRVHWGVLS